MRGDDKMIAVFRAEKATTPDWKNITPEPGMLGVVITMPSALYPIKLSMKIFNKQKLWKRLGDWQDPSG